MRTSSRIATLAAAALMLGACGSDSTAPDTSHLGLYDMVSVDGDPLPATVIDIPGYTLQVTQGDLQLNPNNTFVQGMTTVETVDGVAGPLEGASCLGSYSRRGNVITLTTPETDICFGQTVTGTLSGNTLTVDYDGTIIVYSR